MRQVLALVLWILVVAAPALAQEKSADQLFREGRDAAKKGDHASACRLFGQSYTLDPAVGTLLNIARCEEELGKLASARARYREVVQKSEPASERYKYADSRASSLEPKLSWLTLRIAPALGHVTVNLDGRLLTAGDAAQEIALDPGEHVVEVVDEKGVGTSQRIKLATAERRELAFGEEVTPAPAPVPTAPVMMAPPAFQPAPQPQPQPPPFQHPDRGDLGKTQRIVGLGVAAGGLVAAVVGAIFWQNGKSKHDDALGYCKPSCNDTARSLQDDAKTSITVGNVAMIGGAVLVAGGAVLFFTAPSSQGNLGTVGFSGRWW
jgi:hypothetical protein